MVGRACKSHLGITDLGLHWDQRVFLQQDRPQHCRTKHLPAVPSNAMMPTGMQAASLGLGKGEGLRTAFRECNTSKSITLWKGFLIIPCCYRVKKQCVSGTSFTEGAFPQPSEKLVWDNKVHTANKPFMALFRGVWSQDEATRYQK